VVRHHKPSGWQAPEPWSEIPETARARVQAATNDLRFERILAAANLPDPQTEAEEFERLAGIIKKGVAAIGQAWGEWRHIDDRPTIGQRLTALKKVETASQALLEAIAALDGHSRCALEHWLPSSIQSAASGRFWDYRVPGALELIEEVTNAAHKAIAQTETEQQNAKLGIDPRAPVAIEAAIAGGALAFPGLERVYVSTMDYLIENTRDDEPAKRKLVRHIAGIWEVIGHIPKITKPVDSAVARAKGNVSGRFASFARSVALAVEEADAEVCGVRRPIGPLDSELDIVTKEYRRLAKARNPGK
jgi:hypothetical protein